VPRVAVTFDAGQTLVELDPAMLARRLGERGVQVDAAALEAAVPAAWARYDEVIGRVARPWHVLMDALLEGAGCGDGRAALVAWLWDEQPRANLWRRPVAGMIELVDALRAAGVPVGVLSNSEGKLAELFDEIGWGGRFDVVIDSGR
jgi:FMN phosphatase YigB (HAD superfamily)